MKTNLGFKTCTYKKDNTSYCWNFIDSKLNNEVVQAGILKPGYGKPNLIIILIPYTFIIITIMIWSAQQI
jgi:hypothetical protein